MCLLWAKARRSCCRVQREGKEGFLDQRGRRGRGEGDHGCGEELPSGHVLCTRLRVAVSRLLGDRLGVGGGSSSKAEQAWQSSPPFAWTARLFVGNRTRRHRAQRSVPLVCEGGSLFLSEGPWSPSTCCSHVRRMSLEDRLLFCLPPRSRRRTSFGRHRRSVQARVSVCEVTPDA